jgi:hypothetical protein
MVPGSALRAVRDDSGEYRWSVTLASAPDSSEDGGMRRALVSFCVCWFAFCAEPRSNIYPLAFGMTPPEASQALGVPLTYYSGRGGSEVYLAVGSAGVPGFFPVDTALTLQFRRGHLTGWKQDYRLRRLGPHF